MDIKPHLNPDNPVKIQKGHTNALQDTFMHELNGTKIVNSYVRGTVTVQPPVENPFMIGGKVGRYEIKCNGKKEKINGNSPSEAVKKFYKLYFDGKDVTILATKINNKRKNNSHSYHIKKSKNKIIINKL